MPEEEGDGVVERAEDGREHELVLAAGTDDVKGQVDGLLVQDEVVVVQEDVAWAQVVVGVNGGLLSSLNAQGATGHAYRSVSASFPRWRPRRRAAP